MYMCLPDHWTMKNIRMVYYFPFIYVVFHHACTIHEISILIDYCRILFKSKAIQCSYHSLSLLTRRCGTSFCSVPRGVLEGDPSALCTAVLLVASAAVLFLVTSADRAACMSYHPQRDVQGCWSNRPGQNNEHCRSNINH